jgi:hypothetical protein
MNTSNGRLKMIAWVTGIVVVVVVAIILVVVYANNGAAPAVQSAATGTSTDTTTTSSTGATVTTASTGGAGTGHTAAGAAVPTIPTPSIVIHLLTPIADSGWTIGGTNSIAWDNAAGVTGEIDLVTADTHAFVGVILSETGPNQTSYSWDAREIYLARYGADKKDVVPGVYAVSIHFDGNGLGNLISGPITISN